MHLRRHPSPRRGDRGAILLLFVLSIGAVATVGALVLGGSTGYSAVRNSQNAADAAAVAATATLHQILNEETVAFDNGASTVYTTAKAAAEDNGVDVADNGPADLPVRCEIVTATYALGNAPGDVIGPCDGTNETDPLAAGVRITVQETRDVPLGQFVDAEDLTVSSVAAATMQPLREGAAPFMVCANATGHSVPLLHSLNSPWAVNEVAIGTSVVLWGDAMKEDGRNCGSPSSSWRGLTAFEGSWPIPSPDTSNDTDWWEIKTGNSGGHIPRLLGGTDACGGSIGDALNLIDCVLAMPLCTHGNGASGDNFRLHCVRLGAFEITYNSKGGGSSGPAPCYSGNTNNLICATFLGSRVAVGGDTAASTPYEGEVVAIRLVE